MSSHYSAPPMENRDLRAPIGSKEPRAGSSAGERVVHTDEVAGSTPARPTIAPIIIARFWSKVRVDPDDTQCWEWQGAYKRPNGYGNFKVGKRNVPAHRLAWELFHGHPGDLFVLHRCDNRKCCNPKHLFLGTHQDNMDDMVAKGRSSRRDMRGTRNPSSKLTPEQVREIVDLMAVGKNNKQIAARYGITHQAVSAIRHGKVWGHLTGRSPSPYGRGG